MERTCQTSYPLNSANASPPGTFKLYLSWAAWADMALPPKALTSAVTIAIVHMRLLFITSSSLIESDATGRETYRNIMPPMMSRVHCLHGAPPPPRRSATPSRPRRRRQDAGFSDRSFYYAPPPGDDLM